MKINIGRIARVLGQFAVAAPAVITAARPVLDALRKPKANVSQSAADTAPGTGRPVPDVRDSWKA